MALYLLDSDAIIDYLAAIPPSVELIEELNAGNILCTCDVVVSEVYTGLHPAAAEKVEVLFRRMRFLPTGLEAAMQAGRWRYDFARKGVALSITDALIAATCHSYNATIVTGNQRDYPMKEVATHGLPRSRKPR